MFLAWNENAISQVGLRVATLKAKYCEQFGIIVIKSNECNGYYQRVGYFP